MMKQIKALLLCVLLVLAIAGCASQDTQEDTALQASSSRASAPSPSIAESSSQAALATSGASSTTASAAAPDAPAASDTATAAAGALTVHFGDDGAPFTMHLYDNSTAAAIAGYVGTADWRLPIYNYDGYDNWEVMQYYDLPSRYEIPSNAEAITAEKSGEVFYSEPNRIVLFYGDGEVAGEYTPIGYFDATAEFVSAVSDNPVLEGWSNKIVLIKD